MKTIGIIGIRGNRNLQNLIWELEVYCEKIFVIEKSLDEIDLESENPDWIISIYSDELPTNRLRYMFDSLTLNQYVNTWTSKLVYMWDEETYRIDGLWGNFNVPFLWRYISEVNYQFEEHKIIPENLNGSTEDSSVPILNYEYATDTDRFNAYIEYLETKDENNYITKMHYESLMDDEIKLERWIE